MKQSKNKNATILVVVNAKTFILLDHLNDLFINDLNVSAPSVKTIKLEFMAVFINRLLFLKLFRMEISSPELT